MQTHAFLCFLDLKNVCQTENYKSYRLRRSYKFCAKLNHFLILIDLT